MRTVLSLATVLLALFAAAPAVASGSPAGAHVKRQAAPRGRPNHADLYGYPHGRGDHSGTRSPPPTNNQPMTPGGYKDPRPANPGAQCRTNSACSTDVKNARAVCIDGKCSFSCLRGTTLSEGACTGIIGGDRCQKDSRCTFAPPNGYPVCTGGRCNFGCNDGYRAQGSVCIPSATMCGGVQCPKISNGYTTCENNTCVPHCNAYLGYKMHCNADQTVCSCIDTEHDKNNCGAPGTMCPPGYNGKGKPYCWNGQCELSCWGFNKICPRGGDCYCSSS